MYCREWQSLYKKADNIGKSNKTDKTRKTGKTNQLTLSS